MNTQTQTPDINTPRAGTKQAKLVGMLSRKSGVTLAKASETLGWMATPYHTGDPDSLEETGICN